MTEKENQFPTEVVTLPSQGHFYQEDSVLASGKVTIKYPTAKQEDILTSANLIQSGIVLDKFLESIIVDKFNLEDLLIGDKNAILISSRILAYGKNYNFTIDCSKCDEQEEIEFDLTTVVEKPIEFEKFKKGNNEFEFQLPISKRNITFKLLTHKDENEIETIIKGLTKFNKGKGIIPEITTRFKRMITSINGDTTSSAIISFIDNDFLSQDSKSFREYTETIMPDVNMTHTFECSICDHTEEVRVPMTAQFFWPTSRI